MMTWLIYWPWAAGALLGVAGGAALAWKRPVYLLALLVWLLPFHVFLIRALSARAGLPVALISAISLWKEAVIVLLAVALALRRLTGKDRFPLSFFRFDAGLAAVALLMGGYVFLADRLTIGLYGLRNYLEPVAVFYLVRALPATKSDLKRLVVGMLAACAIMVAVGIYQANAWTFDDLRSWGFVNQTGAIPTAFFTRIGEGDRRLRAMSTVTGPNEMGLISVLVLLWTASLALRRQPGWRRAGLAALFILYAVGLIFTFSRSAILALIVGTGAWGLLTFGARGLPGGLLKAVRGEPDVAVGAALLAAGLIVLAGYVGVFSRFAQALALNDPSAVGHLLSYRAAIPLIVEHPLGTGLGMAGQRAFRFAGQADIVHVESAYLQLMIEIGIPGALLVLGVLLWMVQTLRRRAGQFGDEFWELLGRTTQAAWLGCLVGFAFIPVMQAFQLMTCLWVAAGLSVVTLHQDTSVVGAT